MSKVICRDNSKMLTPGVCRGNCLAFSLASTSMFSSPHLHGGSIDTMMAGLVDTVYE